MDSIEKIEEEIKNLNLEISKLMKEASKKEDERVKMLIANGLLIKNLSEYEGKDLRSIDAYDKDGNSVYIPTDEILEVIDGRLYCSSFNRGIVKWSEEKKCYCHLYHMTTEDLDIEGFLDIEVDED